jgi:hypothetical protein
VEKYEDAEEDQHQRSKVIDAYQRLLLDPRTLGYYCKRKNVSMQSFINYFNFKKVTTQSIDQVILDFQLFSTSNETGLKYIHKNKLLAEDRLAVTKSLPV